MGGFFFPAQEDYDSYEGYDYSDPLGINKLKKEETPNFLGSLMNWADKYEYEGTHDIDPITGEVSKKSLPGILGGVIGDLFSIPKRGVDYLTSKASGLEETRPAEEILTNALFPKYDSAPIADNLLKPFIESVPGGALVTAHDNLSKLKKNDFKPISDAADVTENALRGATRTGGSLLLDPTLWAGINAPGALGTGIGAYFGVEGAKGAAEKLGESYSQAFDQGKPTEAIEPFIEALGLGYLGKTGLEHSSRELAKTLPEIKLGGGYSTRSPINLESSPAPRQIPNFASAMADGKVPSSEAPSFITDLLEPDSLIKRRDELKDLGVLVNPTGRVPQTENLFHGTGNAWAERDPITSEFNPFSSRKASGENLHGGAFYFTSSEPVAEGSYAAAGEGVGPNPEVQNVGVTHTKAFNLDAPIPSDVRTRGLALIQGLKAKAENPQQINYYTRMYDSLKSAADGRAAENILTDVLYKSDYYQNKPWDLSGRHFRINGLGQKVLINSPGIHSSEGFKALPLKQRGPRNIKPENNFVKLLDEELGYDALKHGSRLTGGEVTIPFSRHQIKIRGAQKLSPLSERSTESLVDEYKSLDPNKEDTGPLRKAIKEALTSRVSDENQFLTNEFRTKNKDLIDIIEGNNRAADYQKIEPELTPEDEALIKAPLYESLKNPTTRVSESKTPETTDVKDWIDEPLLSDEAIAGTDTFEAIKDIESEKPREIPLGEWVDKAARALGYQDVPNLSRIQEDRGGKDQFGQKIIKPEDYEKLHRDLIATKLARYPQDIQDFFKNTVYGRTGLPRDPEGIRMDQYDQLVEKYDMQFLEAEHILTNAYQKAVDKLGKTGVPEYKPDAGVQLEKSLITPEEDIKHLESIAKREGEDFRDPRKYRTLLDDIEKARKALPEDFDENFGALGDDLTPQMLSPYEPVDPAIGASISNFDPTEFRTPRKPSDYTTPKIQGESLSESAKFIQSQKRKYGKEWETKQTQSEGDYLRKLLSKELAGEKVEETPPTVIQNRESQYEEVDPEIEALRDSISEKSPYEMVGRTPPEKSSLDKSIERVISKRPPKTPVPKEVDLEGASTKKTPFQVSLSNGEVYTVKATDDINAREQVQDLIDKHKSKFNITDVKPKYSKLESDLITSANPTETALAGKLSRAQALKEKQLRESKAKKAQEEFQAKLDKKEPSGISQFLGSVKALASSGDLGHIARQGKQGTLYLLTHKPSEVGTAFKRMAKQTFSEKEFTSFHEKLAQDPKLLRMSKDFRLDMPGLPGHLGEEAFHGGEAIESAPVIGAYVKASDRAYTSYMNSIRYSLVKDGISRLEKSGFTMDKNPEKYRELARGINIITQRGDISGKAAQLFNTASNVFWAPRAKYSRIQQIGELVKPGESGRLARQGLVHTMAFNALLFGLLKAKYGDAVKFNTDPENTDFLKIRIKNTTVDPWFGLGAIIRSANQGISGEKTSGSTGKTVPVSASDTVGSFLTNSLAPGITMLYELASGKSTLGFEKSRLESLLGVAPLAMRDIKDITEEHGLDGLLLDILSYEGEQVNTFNPQKAKKEQERLKKERGLKPSKPKSSGTGTVNYKELYNF